MLLLIQMQSASQFHFTIFADGITAKINGADNIAKIT